MFVSDKNPFVLYLKVKYPNESFEILNAFERPHVGWEIDYNCVVVKVSSKTILLGTNHGQVYEMDQAELQQITTELQDWLSDALYAATLLSSNINESPLLNNGDSN
jgi:hypothetical protein